MSTVTAEVQSAVIAGVRGGMTVREAAAAAGTTRGSLSYFRNGGSVESVAFAEALRRAMRDGMPRRASRKQVGTACRVLRDRTGARPALQPAEVSTVGGMQVASVRRMLELHEVAFLARQSVRRVRGLVHQCEQDPDAPLGLPATPGPRGRRLVAVETAARHPLIAGDPLALVLLARLVEDRLEVPRPASDTADPEDHIVVLRALL